ncbi:hypothetical protein WH47_04245 [Habropoda laboriosa]|uniref:Tumor protein p53-inducible protein 13 n=1 Tax=Habropoda laboriosa TaxID=597456 RepID=A0A0L7QVK1_9HYME|nr:PREDICTED: uncharacterized protein LOC108574958 isoform X2 [Habropoda laboriosa]KOC62584.1 hypothetical protein WH47_04245 [Habropoda laboriosa]
MKTEVILLLFGCCFVATNVANDDFHGDNYIEEDLQNVDFDRLRLLRKYAYDTQNGENRRNVNDDELENWKGRWMPDRPNDPIPPPKIFPKKEQTSDFQASQSMHGVPMGYISVHCDDAKTNLTVDWDGNPSSYTCYDKRIVPDRNTVANMYCERIPKYYVAMHKCMYEEIQYDDDIPVFGSHRPLWPVYGEYKFLPKQRWLHSLEHGAIVMLYHPCANPLEVRRMKNLLTGCLRRHVITPYDLLDEHRPLALVSWGCRLTMSYVNPELVIGFVREHALRGPEEIARDGAFVEGLLRQAKTVSDLEDTILCPSARAI